MKEKTPDPFPHPLNDSGIAHVDPETGRIQGMGTHSFNVAWLGNENCPLELLRNLLIITLFLHDAGKFSEEFDHYMMEISEKGEKARRRQIDHSSAGGRIIEHFLPKKQLVGQMAATAIYSHHGLQDCIELSSGETLSEKRRKKEAEIDFENVKKRFFQTFDKDVLKAYILRAHQDVEKIYQLAAAAEKRDTVPGKYGNKYFFLGMYERILLSVLIDSDWSDTASFQNKEPLPKRMSVKETQDIWTKAIEHFERHMAEQVQKGNYSPLNQYRNEISNLCFQAAKQEQRLYRLTVPTGAGKTLSSLRFALYHAQKYEKRHIFYVAPYNSILEQNAKEIREAVGMEEYVLEHHCNVIPENEEQEQIYKKLTENWDNLFIVTTAVQMLNTLFSAQKSSIRRMYSLCNSVIIFDEVQAIPTRCMELFHLAVNFLTEFCNTTVVLCSATQPSLAELKENNLFPCPEMAGDIHRYMEAFRRTEIEDVRKLVPGGMNAEDLADFTMNAFREFGSALVVLNTKNAVRKVYDELKKSGEEGYELYHLSTNMCPVHRQQVLDAIRRALAEARPVICVSTPLIEAGVNLSFGCVIRSLSGMDSAVQAAGRCNRHKEKDKFGKVYIIKMSDEVENTDKMREIRTAKNASEKFLDQFKLCPDYFANAVDSMNSIKRYYELYYQSADVDSTKYCISLDGVPDQVTLVDLLGYNGLGRKQYEQRHREKYPYKLAQAFRTAGEKFEVIQEDQKISVIVPYDENAKNLIRKLEDRYVSFEDQKRILRSLQRYTVGVSPHKKDLLETAARPVGEAGVLVWNMEYYDANTGVTESRQDRFCDYFF